MKKLLGLIFAAFLFSQPALAADSNLPPMTAASALTDTDLMYCGQSVGTLDRKCTPLQLSTYIFGKVSGDLTCSAGVCTLTTVNANVGSFGSATACTSFTVNAKGLITAASSATCAPAIGSVTGIGTGGGAALVVNVGTAGSFVVNGGALGTPSSGVATNLTGTAAGLTAGNVTTNANLTGAITSVGNAASLGSFSSAQLLAALSTKTGTGSSVFGTAPTIDSLNATTAMTLAFLTGGGTQCLQVSNTGVVSATGAVCGGSGASGANPTATASDTAVNGVASTFMRSDAAPAVQKTSASVFGLAKVDGTTITAASGVITAVPGVTSRTVSGATDTILSTDRGNVVYYNSASSIAVSQPAPSGAFAAGFFTTLCQNNNGVPTVTPASGTIGGASTYALPAGGTAAAPVCMGYQSDGTNFNLVPDFAINASLLTSGTVAAARGGAGTITGALKGNGSGVVSQAACADLSNGTALCSTTPGTGVATAAAANLSAAGGLTTTIAGGTAALGTGAIASAACATVVTVVAANVATTDVVSASFNGDPTAVTGYIPATAGMLTIIGYPTSGNVNFKVCNNTSASITPGAITLNWRVVR